MPLNKVTKARRRNWLKMRLMGLVFVQTEDILTIDEQGSLGAMIGWKDELLRNWDKNSEKVMGKTFPKYKCWCSKRTNVLYLIRDVRTNGVMPVCREHYLETPQQYRRPLQDKMVGHKFEEITINSLLSDTVEQREVYLRREMQRLGIDLSEQEIVKWSRYEL